MKWEGGRGLRRQHMSMLFLFVSILDNREAHSDIDWRFAVGYSPSARVLRRNRRFAGPVFFNRSLRAPARVFVGK